MSELPVGVVGSGAAAAGVVHALVESGIRPVVLDVGQTLEPERESLKRELAMRDPGDWAPEMLKRARGDYRCTPDGLEIKMQMGSDYSTRFPQGENGLEFESMAHIPSFAFGGLSNIWGASILPYRSADIRGWPFGVEELLPHYRAVARLTGSTGEPGDAIDRLFPCVCEQLQELPLSRSAAGLLADLKHHETSLCQAGMNFGMARLALQAEDNADRKGCRKCGLCMHGCPYDLIFSSAHPFSKWIAAGKVDYRPGCLVRRFEEKEGAVEVEWSAPSGEIRHARFSRLFLSAGVIPTTRIVLSSLQMFDVPVEGKDSHYFLFPLLRIAGSGDVRSERLQTLSQIFVDLVDPVLEGKTGHAQIYSYSDIIDSSVAAMLGPLRRFSPPVLSRMLIAQVFLHSDHSAKLVFRLRRTGGGGERLHVRGVANPASARFRRHVLWKFSRHALHLRAIPGLPFVKVGAPGRGLHCGGTFPMSKNPRNHQTDLLGRLPGFQRTHIADSSVLPSIPGTTIAFSAMANAHRIASLALTSSQ
ncbi:MAG: GMC oxidoreductase [Terrimicrobiaceae bacterium]|nr:GMC oxidoreductase [Terrimicrobiaceae bacterium]